MNLGDICSSKYRFVGLEEGLWSRRLVKNFLGQDTVFVLAVADFKWSSIGYLQTGFPAFIYESEGCDSPLRTAFPECPLNFIGGSSGWADSEMEEGTLVIALKMKNSSAFHHTQAIQELLSNKTLIIHWRGFSRFENIEEEIVVSTGEGLVAFLHFNPMLVS